MRSILPHNETQAVLNFTVWSQARIRQAMAEARVTRAELARRTGLSKSRMTQIFGEYPNVTLETVARLFFALGEVPRLVTERELSDRAERPITEDW